MPIEIIAMAEDERELRWQARTAHVLLAAAALFVVGPIALTITGWGSVPMVLAAVPVGALFAFFGYRVYAATKRGEVLADERDGSHHERAASFSFYLLLTVILAEGAFDVVPNDEVAGVLTIVAVVSLVASTLYYKFVPNGLLFRRDGPTQGDT